MIKFRGLLIILFCLTMIGVLAACGNTNGEKGEMGSEVEGKTPLTNEGSPVKEVPPAEEPVTLSFYFNTVIDDFEIYINQHVKKKFPFVTLNVVEKSEGNDLKNLIAGGQIPDIVWEGLTNIRGSLELDLPMDLTELAKKHNFDFNVYDSKVLESIKSYSNNGEVYYLPFNVFVFATQYNKQIFDKFGISMIKDGMTWDEMVEVGRQITRLEDGVQYRGLQIGNTNRTQTQLSLDFADPKTDKASFQTDGWKKMLQLWKDVNDIPGQPLVTKFNTARNDFYQEKTLAMFPDILMLQNTDMAAAEKDGLDWDVVTFPTFKDLPQVGAGVFSDGFYIPNGSKHPDLAFQIISYLSGDTEVQLNATKNGRLTGLKDSTIRNHAFENNPAAKGKNLGKIYDNQFATPHQSTEYDRAGLSIINKKIISYIKGESDMNTLLREADEELNRTIAEMK